MIAEAIQRSPLAGYAQRFAALHEATNGGISIRELPFLTQINLRVDPNDETAMQRLSSFLGFDLPLTPNTVATAGGLHALWLGPDEWLIVGADDHAKRLEQPLGDALTGASAAIVEVSASRAVLLIQGERTPSLLAHGITIDLHPRVFAPDRCVQTLLAKAQVILERRTRDDAFQLYVRCSSACYLADWLLDAAADPLRRSGS